MAVKLKHGLPDAIQRREILAGNPKYAVNLDELGGRYLQKGWLSDAIDCFERAKNAAKLGEILKLAIERDVFLVARIEKSGLVKVSPADWRRAGERALAEGRDRSAVTAFERAGAEDLLAQARERTAALKASLEAPKKGRGGLEFAR